jgi:hypothetical protein
MAYDTPLVVAHIFGAIPFNLSSATAAREAPVEAKNPTLILKHFSKFDPAV